MATRARALRRSTSSPITSFLTSKTTRDNKPGKKHEPQTHRRRPHHPSHHRTGNYLPARTRNVPWPDAGTAGGEPGVAAKGRRARRPGYADPVFPVLRGEDAAPHHPDRQLHRQRQVATAATEMEHEDRRHLHE